jgi:hypothetical protein
MVVTTFDSSVVIRLMGSLLSLLILFISKSSQGISPEQDLTDLVRRPAIWRLRHPVRAVKRLVK